MAPIVKICGLSTSATLAAALDAGADMVGFVFFPKSPRHVDWATARALGRQARDAQRSLRSPSTPTTTRSTRIVDALSPDLLQLHGGESPARVKRIGELCARPTMKAIGVSAREDLAAAGAYEERCGLAADRRQAAERRGAARRQRSALRLGLGAGFRAASPLASFRRSRPRHGRRGDRADRRPRRRRLLGRRARARVKDIAKIKAFVAAARGAFARAAEGVE